MNEINSYIYISIISKSIFTHELVIKEKKKKNSNLSMICFCMLSHRFLYVNDLSCKSVQDYIVLIMSLAWFCFYSYMVLSLMQNVKWLIFFSLLSLFPTGQSQHMPCFSAILKQQLKGRIPMQALVKSPRLLHQCGTA